MKNFANARAVGICLMVISLVTQLTLANRSLAQDSGADQVSATVKEGDGLESVEFDTLTGIVTVDLPDDMSETDTISGSVIAEPKGETKEEIQQNEDTLQGYVVEVEETQEVLEPEAPKAPEHPKQVISKAQPKCPPSKPKCEASKPIISHAPPEIHTVPHRRESFSCYIPKTHKKVNVCIKDKRGNVIARKPLPCSAKPPVKPTKCIIPPQGTCDAPLKIVGPCDGRSSTSKVTCNGRKCDTLAESPRKQICKMPKDIPGKCVIKVTEAGNTTSGFCFLQPAKAAVARVVQPPKPKTTQPTPKTTQPTPVQAKDMFRRTGPFIEGGGSYQENTMRIDESQCEWTGHSVRDKPNSPMRTSVFSFTPPPEIATVGDTISINCNLTGSELFWGSASVYSGSAWLKLLHNPTEGLFDERHTSASLSFQVNDLNKLLEEYRRKEPEKARSLPSSYPFEISVLLQGPHHPQATMKWVYVPYTPSGDR